MANNESDKTTSGSVEVVLLRDSNLGSVGEIVKVSKLDVDTYKAHGFIDDSESAIHYAKSQGSEQNSLPASQPASQPAKKTPTLKERLKSLIS